MKRRQFLASMISAGIACAFLPGASRLWKPNYLEPGLGSIKWRTINIDGNVWVTIPETGFSGSFLAKTEWTDQWLCSKKVDTQPRGVLKCLYIPATLRHEDRTVFNLIPKNDESGNLKHVQYQRVTCREESLKLKRISTRTSRFDLDDAQYATKVDFVKHIGNRTAFEVKPERITHAQT